MSEVRFRKYKMDINNKTIPNDCSTGVCSLKQEMKDCDAEFDYKNNCSIESNTLSTENNECEVNNSDTLTDVIKHGDTSNSLINNNVNMDPSNFISVEMSDNDSDSNKECFLDKEMTPSTSSSAEIKEEAIEGNSDSDYQELADLHNTIASFFYIVEFTEEGSYENVPFSWVIDGIFCYWPPATSMSKIQALVKNMQKPDLNSWTKHPITIIGIERTYEEAIESVERIRSVQVTTDLSGRNKRKRLSRRSPSLSDDENMPELSISIKYPDVHTAQRKSTSCFSKNKTLNGSDISNQYSSSDVVNSYSVVKKLDIISRRQDDIVRKQIEMDNKLDNFYTETRNMFLALQRQLYCLQNDNCVSIDENYQEFKFLPVDNVVLFQGLVNMLAIEEYHQKFVNMLSQYGGDTLVESVRRIMSKILTDAIAKKFNLTGKNDKNKFGHDILMEAIYKAIKRNKDISGVTQRQIEHAVSKWLINSRDRGVCLRKKKQEDKNQNLAPSDQ